MLQAAKAADYDAITPLLRKGADINYQVMVVVVVVSTTSRHNRPSSSYFLIVKCPARKMRTALHLAILTAAPNNEAGLRTVDLLLDSGAKLTIADVDGNFAIHLAVLMSNARVVSTLLEYGAVVSVRNTLGETPIEVAARTGAVACLE